MIDVGDGHRLRRFCLPGLVAAGVLTMTAWLSACGDTESPRVWPDDYAEVMEPETCQECHPDHYRQWQGSMHAYAADDPVFLAMNQRGQRETNGELGDFCIKCHAPLAVELGSTFDGLNAAQLPRWQKGVTCYFCHNTVEVGELHNNSLTLAKNDVMRAAIGDPVVNPAHQGGYSRLLHSDSFESSRMCGACHDIVTPGGVFLERTHHEWQNSLFADASPTDPDKPAFYAQTCSHCHMDRAIAMQAIADFDGARGDREYHDHRFVGIDAALTPFPTPELAPALMADQREGIDEQRDEALCASLCVQAFPQEARSEATVWLHNEGAGHSWPSGAAQDRRAWVELIASKAGVPVFRSGVVADNEPIAKLVDPNLWLFRDTLHDAAGNEVHMFWDATEVRSNLLPVRADLSADDVTWVSRVYPITDAAPESVSMRVRLRAMGLDVLDDLIASGDLDPSVRTAIRTEEVPPVTLTWTPEAAEDSPLGGSCVHTSLSCYAPGSKTLPLP